MRFFIALDISEENREQIRIVQNKLKELVPQIRLTDPEKLHLTIAFIGEEPDSLETALVETIQKAVVGIPPFQVVPAYIDGFPHLHTAHTLWIGVKGDIDKLYKLRHRIKDSLIKINIAVDPRRYVPHIAIGKAERFRLADNIEKRLENLMTPNLDPIKVSSVKLFQSIPNHSFHTHNTLAEITLGI